MKGILKSFESVLAAIIVLSTYIILFSGQQALPEFETINWKLLAFNSVASLDQNNQLRVDALSNNTASLKTKLADFIRAPLNFDVQVCSLNCTKPDVAASKIASVEYLISGDVNNITNKQVVVFVWFSD